MTRATLIGVTLIISHLALGQEGEIVEAQRRVAIISVGSEQGIQASDTLWVSDVNEKKDRLVAKATVIALRKRFAAIEAFQYFGDYRLAVGQRVYRVKDIPAPLTAPPKRNHVQSQKPELTVAEVRRQRLRFFVFAGVAKPLGALGRSFSESFGAGAGMRLAILSNTQMSLSGRYIFMSNADAVQQSLTTAGQSSSTSLATASLTFSPFTRFVTLEAGPVVLQSQTKTALGALKTKATSYEIGAVAGIGKYFNLTERLGWALQANLYTYFPGGRVRNFVTADLQLHF
jgi:hypothetical protein